MCPPPKEGSVLQANGTQNTTLNVRRRRRQERERKRKRNAPRVVALSTDQVPGSLSGMRRIYERLLKAGLEPPVQLFLSCLRSGTARPFLRELFLKLREWLQQGRIDRVVIYTTESNENGWVSFIANCLEEYAETPDLIDQVITREQCPRARIPGAPSTSSSDDGAGLHVFKDLSLLSPDPQRVVIIQGQPEYIVNGLVIGVPDYNANVPFDRVKEYLVSELKWDPAAADAAKRADMAGHPLSQEDWTQDNAFEVTISELEKVFPRIPGTELTQEETSSPTLTEPDATRPQGDQTPTRDQTLQSQTPGSTKCS